MKSANPLSDALHVMAHLVGQDGPRTSEQLASCLTHPVVIRRRWRSCTRPAWYAAPAVMAVAASWPAVRGDHPA
jgi:hypothetical protein